MSKGDRRRDEQDAEEPFGEEEGDALPENQAPEEPAQEGEEAPPEGATPDEEGKPAEIKKTQLLFGIILAVLGLIGIASLRTGLVQSMLGHADYSAGIGDQEVMGIGASLVPVALGIILIGMWGAKNDPIYNRLQKMKEEEDEDLADLDLGQPEPELPAEVPEEFSEPLPDLEQPVPEPETELEEEELPPAEPPIQERMAEEMRVERCSKMLSAVVILPDDKARLGELIKTGISPEDFAQELKEAVARRRKKEREKDVTADEKAAILEDELVAELDSLDTETRGDSKLEEDILKELDDLGDL